MSKGQLIVVSGFSGVGKNTLIRRLRELHPGKYAFSVSATTRAPRKEEVDGVDYFFVTEKRFREMIDNNELLEYSDFTTHMYGTPRAYVEQCLEKGEDLILEIELNGAMNVRRLYPEALLIFIAPPSAGELKNRLIGRGSETEESLRLRLNQAKKEAQYMSRYDFILVNDEVDACVSRIHNLIAASRLRTSLQEDFIRTITEEVNEL